jgi:hypothetical protein
LGWNKTEITSFRGKQSRDRGQQGSGLGLWIVLCQAKQRAGLLFRFEPITCVLVLAT